MVNLIVYHLHLNDNVIMRNRGEGETVSPIQIKTHAYKYNNKNNHHKANTECDYEK